VAPQRVARLVAVARQYVAPRAGSWLGVVAREPHGTSVQQAAPWLEVPLDGPWQVVVRLVGLLVQPRRLGRGLLPVGRMSQCSPRSPTHQEKAQ